MAKSAINYTGLIPEIGDSFKDATQNVTGSLDGIDAKLGEINNNISNIVVGGGYIGTENDINKKAQLVDFNRYGKVWLPTDFPTLPFNLERKVDGKIYHDFNFDDLEIGLNKIYVNSHTGVDTNSGTELLPVRSLTKAIKLRDLLSDDTVVIVIKDNLISEAYFVTNGISITKNTIIKSDSSSGGTVFHSGNYDGSLAWTQEGSSYKTTRTFAIQFLDTKYKDILGKPKSYKKVDTLAECQNEKGTWYTDGTLVYIRTLDDINPNGILDRFAIILPKNARVQFNLSDSVKLYIRNLKFYYKANGYNSLRVQGNSIVSNGTEFYHENCVFTLGSSNGLSVYSINKCYGFNGIAYSNYLDGFNYHDFGVNIGNTNFNFEYNCLAFDNGTSAVTNANSTTCHDNMKILRINSVGYNSFGPVLADVNACKSVNYDCTMHDSFSISKPTKSAYYFDTSATTETGYSYLFNCSGGGLDTKSINSDNTQPLYIKNFKGKTTPSCDYILLE